MFVTLPPAEVPIVTNALYNTILTSMRAQNSISVSHRCYLLCLLRGAPVIHAGDCRDCPAIAEGMSHSGLIHPCEVSSHLLGTGFWLYWKLCGGLFEVVVEVV